jgi:hypothetical protein
MSDFRFSPEFHFPIFYRRNSVFRLRIFLIVGIPISEFFWARPDTSHDIYLCTSIDMTIKSRFSPEFHFRFSPEFHFPIFAGIPFSDFFGNSVFQLRIFKKTTYLPKGSYSLAKKNHSLWIIGNFKLIYRSNEWRGETTTMKCVAR